MCKNLYVIFIAMICMIAKYWENIQLEGTLVLIIFIVEYQAVIWNDMVEKNDMEYFFMVDDYKIMWP